MHGRTGGTPPALKAKDLAAANALLQDPEITVLPAQLWLDRRGQVPAQASRAAVRPAADGGRGSRRHAQAPGNVKGPAS